MIESLIEITLESRDDFLKIKETLTRIGIASNKEKKLYQSCHILHKRGKYYIVHFKELFALDGKHANLTVNGSVYANQASQIYLQGCSPVGAAPRSGSPAASGGFGRC